VSLLDAVLEAHGGLERWRRVKKVELKVDGGGIALSLKGQGSALRGLEATTDIVEGHVSSATLGTFSTDQTRPPGIAARFRWTASDIRHFSGYALWGYLNTPFYFAYEDVEVKELSGRRLRVSHPSSPPVHSRVQTFAFNPDALLTHIDYAAEVFLGRLGRVRQHCLEHKSIDGLVFYTKRRVVPHGLPGPALISLRFSDIRVTDRMPAAVGDPADQGFVP